jgi:acyl dehydratase
MGKRLRHLTRHVTVTQEWIDRYAMGIGDSNPLWTDPYYTRHTKYGGTVAPPTMVFCLSGWDIGTGLPGVHGLYTGCEIDWHDVIRPGDEIISHGYLHKVEEKESAFAGLTILQGTETVYENGEEKLVAKVRNYNLRTERRAGLESGTRNKVEHANYTPEQMEEIEETILRQIVRGDLPRRGTDVDVGEELPPVVKGPLTITDMIAYMRTGFGGILTGMFMYAHEFATFWRRRHPGGIMRTPWGYTDSPEAVHWDDYLAKFIGAPGAYDLGPQRIAWMVQTATNWMGDNAFLKSLSTRLTAFVMMGDTIWCSGRVESKEKIEGSTRVVIALSATNQRGEIVATGTAEILLPNAS